MMGSQQKQRMTASPILVLAGKQVGYEILRFLFDLNMPVGLVVASDESDEQIISLAASYHVRHRIHDNHLQTDLIREGACFEWILNLWSPHILSPAFLELGNHRLNVHPGLVPASRGNDPAAWSIRKGLRAGVSLLEMDAGIDHGAVYAMRSVDYHFPTKGSTLHAALQHASISLFKDSWPDIYNGKIQPQPQPSTSDMYTRKMTDTDRIIDAESKMTIKECVTWILAHDFSPGTTAVIKDNQNYYRLTVTVEKI